MISFAHFREFTAHPFSWNSQLLKVQKHDNKQNFDYFDYKQHVIKDIRLGITDSLLPKLQGSR